jgi:broad specificity phosphatase PhoE
VAHRVHVHLVRHGEVENPSAVRYGHLAGFSLSANGREQVQRTAMWLATSTPHTAAIATSPLERARETADLIAARLSVEPVVVDARLTEATSRFDGLPRRIAPLRYARRHLETFSGPGPESPVAIARRMRDAVLDHRGRVREANADAIVLVSHQIPIQYVRHSFERGGLDIDDLFAWVRFQIGIASKPPCAPASITTLVFEGQSLLDVRYSEAV